MAHQKMVLQIGVNIYRRKKWRRERRGKREFNEEDNGFSSGHVEFQIFVSTKYRY